MNIALISLGSNMPLGEENILESIKQILEKAESGRFSSVYDTEPEGIHRHAKYKNCVGEIFTPLSYEEWELFFKDLEIRLGRTPELRMQGNVPIDIDIIIWNREVLRPKDLSMEYVKEGLRSLNGD